MTKVDATVDDLTGLLTRKEFVDRAEPLLELGLKQNRELCLALLDVDGFDGLVQAHGQRTTDGILRQLAEVLRQNVHPATLLARYAADEFIVMMPATTAENGFILLEEIRKHVAGMRFDTIHITVSIGMAACPRDARTIEEVLRKADEALYRAKKEGKNQVCLPQEDRMVVKTNHYTSGQLERLTFLSKKVKKSEAFLLREALDLLLRQYEDKLEGYAQDHVLVQLGAGLVSLALPGRDDSLYHRVGDLRSRLLRDSGAILPGVRIRDSVDLPSHGYEVFIKDAKVMHGTLDPDKPKDVQHFHAAFEKQIIAHLDKL